jgi:hypothetical protein
MNRRGKRIAFTVAATGLATRRIGVEGDMRMKQATRMRPERVLGPLASPSSTNPRMHHVAMTNLDLILGAMLMPSEQAPARTESRSLLHADQPRPSYMPRVIIRNMVEDRWKHLVRHVRRPDSL